MSALSRAAAETAEPQSATALCAQLIEIDESGTPVIEVDGIVQNARLLSHLSDWMHRASSCLPVPVLITRTDNDDLPIVIGIVQSKITTNDTDVFAGRRSVIVDGDKIEFAAHTEIELLCGKSSIKLSKDGKVVIKGAQILTRATHQNKIRGATVQIN
jgi:hypothetical protein